ncbi:P pilus assembly/Cpx signaling pathway, periplasmic inhibitor/zinc-resistance associated protein [Nostoc sp. UHCC 0302]|uniref:Spy/CpxP family protein refolding chaperone n=1 Tax=Nostoc sp. UHCC 0302 TaxID=3134896 RepID=UPI00311CC2B0
MWLLEISSYDGDIQTGKITTSQMKLKALSLVAGAIALTLTATPFTVQAQPTSSTLQVAQVPKKGAWQELGLTEAQKTQIRQIRQSFRGQFEVILTPEQKAKLDAAKQARQARREARQQAGQQPGQQAGQYRRRAKPFADLNLTEQQKAQMRQLRESEKQQIQAILTPEQKAKLQQFRENARSRRQQSNQ